ncbi:MAG: glutaredoxin [Clostridia bacterium]|nr:MAG: glutaredoxin [Clostridia bacterium]
MLTLYQREECPYCHKVRQKMTDLGLTYTVVNVSREREQRQELYSVSGQYLIPVLVDGETVITDSDQIVAYLEKNYRRA